MTATAIFDRLALSRSEGLARTLWTALICTALAVAVRLVLSPVFGGFPGFIVLAPMVVVAALAAGFWAAVLTMVFSLAASIFAARYLPGAGAFDPLAIASGGIAFAFVSLFLSYFGAALRTSLRRQAQLLADLSASQERASASEQRVAMLSEHAPAMLWMTDPKGRGVHMNRRLRQFWGVEGPASAFDYLTTVHPEDLERVKAVTFAAAAAREPFEIEARYRRADGAWRTLHTRVSPRLEDGRFVGMIGVNEDVTEARAFQTALARSEGRFRAAIEAVSGILWTNSPEGRMEGEQPGWSALTGQTRDQYEGFGWSAAVHPDDAQPTIDAWNAAVAERRVFEFEHRLRRRDGEWRTFSIRAVPTLDAQGDVLEWVGVHTDVTEQRLAEAHLRESEARFRLLADTAPSAVWLTNTQGEVEFANRALAEFYGKPADQLRGHVWRERLHPDDMTAIEAVQAQARPTHQPYGFEARFRNVDGDWRWMRVAVTPRFGADGDFQGYIGLSFDVTDQRQALDSARESEARFRAIADTAPVLIWVTGQDRVREFVNQAYVAFNGGSYEEARLADWRAAIHPEDQARVLQESLAGEATGQPFSLEARYRRHDGVWRWLKSFSRPRLDGAGEVIGFVGVAFDVTDIRESNERLTAFAAEREAILGQLAEGVIVTDREGRIIFVNEAASRIHGVAALDVPPDDYSATYRLFTEDGSPYPSNDLPLARAVRGETVQEARWIIRRPDGVEVQAVGNARPVLDPQGGRIGAVLTLRDDTARLLAERRLQESETRFRTVADSAPALIYMIDQDRQVVFANRRYKTFFGVEAEAMLGDGWRAIVHEEDVDAFHVAFNEAFVRRDRFERLVRVRHPSLGVRWLRCEAIPRFDAAGAFQGYVGANLDVTEAKEAEDNLTRINELLEERVGEALAEKAKAEADLMHAQRMEAVGRLTGGVAHDFNNLLTVVIGALDIILRSPDDAAKRKRLGEAALSAARRGERLTHQLLAFSRRQALRPEPVDLNLLIAESEPLLQRAVGEAVLFRLELSAAPARVHVDAAQFEAALLNLIVNARDAVGEAGSVTISTTEETIAAGQVLDLAPGPYVVVSVTDTGAGMPPEVIERVFEPFFTTKPIGKGTGLGLSQVYGFTRQSGGGARIRSTPGEGTEVRLYLPAKGPEPEAAGTAERASGPDRVSGRRVLLVEDDEAVAAVAGDLLREMGMVVTEAASAPAALDRLRDQTFDLMLTDMVMPGGMTGVELGHEVARLYPDMRIVLASGYVGDDVDAQLKDAPWPFLKKPYSADELRAVLGGEG